MTDPTASPRHLPMALVRLHWLTLLLVLAAIACVLLREGFDTRAVRGLLLDGHRNLGLLVLAVTLLRLGLRWQRRADLPDGIGSRTERLAAAVVQRLLYGLLLLLPLLGWLASDAHGQTPVLFGVLALPKWIATDPDRAESLAELHGTLAWSFVALLGLHAAAAIRHHLRGEHVLRAMRLRAVRPLERRLPTSAS